MLFIRNVPSLTRILTGRDELAFVTNWGGWLSLIALAMVAYGLILVPLRKRA